MIYGIIVPYEADDKKAAEQKIRKVVDGLDEPEAVVTNGGEGLPSFTARYAQTRWPNAIHQVIAPPVPRPAHSFDYKLKRIARVQLAPAGTAGQSLLNAEDMLNGVVDKIIALVETRHNSDSVLHPQIQRAKDRGVQVKTEKLPHS